MDRVSRYSYINAKLRARIGLMAGSSLLEDMIKAPNLSEAIAVLSGTKYDSLFETYSRTADLQQVELELFIREIRLHEEIIKVLDDRTARFVKTLLEKTEIENIKNAVRLWYSASVLHHSISYRSAYIYKDRIVHDIDWSRIINALGWDDVRAAFRNTPYLTVFDRYDAQDITRLGLFEFEIDLDHLWFDRLYGAMDLLDGADREVALKVYGLDVDLKNIINLIRYGFYHSCDSSRLAHVFIHYGSLYGVLEKRLASGNFSIEEARDLIRRRYARVGELLGQMEVRGQLSTGHSELAYGTLAIENYLAQQRRKEFTGILCADPFTIGTILSYIYLCRSEDNTIKGILAAKYYNWSEEQIRRELN